MSFAVNVVETDCSSLTVILRLRSSIVEGCAILRHNRIAAPIFTGRIEPKNESASHGGDRTWQEQCAAGIAAPASGGGCLIVAIPDSVILANKRRIYRRNTSSVITDQKNRSANDGAITRFGWEGAERINPDLRRRQQSAR